MSLYQKITAKKFPCRFRLGYQTQLFLHTDYVCQSLKYNPCINLAAPCRKKARLSPAKSGDANDTNHQLPNFGSVRSPLRQLQPNPLLNQNYASVERKSSELSSAKSERRRVFRRPPMSCESVSVTRTDGQRLYLSIKCDRDEEKSSIQSKVYKCNHDCF